MSPAEARYRHLFAHSRDALLLVDGRTLEIEDANPAAAELSGYALEELIGMDGLRLSAEPEATRASIELLRGGHQTSLRVERRWGLRKDGTRVPVEIQASILEVEGQPKLFAAIRDISTRWATETALADSEERFRSIFHGAAAGMATADTEGRLTAVNAAFCRMLGYRDEELLGRTIRDITHPDDWETNRVRFEGALRGEISGYQLEKRYLAKDGHSVRALISSAWVRDAQGRPLHSVGLIQDISELAETRRALELAQFSLDRAADAVFWLTPEARIVYANDAACRSLDYPRETLYRMGVPDIDPNFPEGACERMWRRIKAESRVRIESAHRRRDGSTFPVEISANYLAHGGEEYNCVIARDISERHQAERELRQAHKMEALGQLTGGVAHDFNNVLAVMLGFSELGLLRLGDAGEAADAHLAEYLKEILTAGRRGRDLVDQMLRFGRGAEGAPQVLQLQPLVSEMARMLRPTLPSSIGIELNLDGNVPPVAADAVQVHQALMNLCVNARDAMEGQGTLGIRLALARRLRGECSACHTRLEGDWVDLSVTDTGRGIPPDLLERIFDPFFTTKEVGKGTGMGLAVVHGILRQHGAHVLVESRPGEGSRFRLLFRPQAAAPSASSDGRETAEPGGARRPARILVVDDEPALVKLLCHLLERQGYRPDGLTDAAAALGRLREEPGGYDLLVTDQTMPGLTGVELAAQARELRPGLPVVLCTGHSDRVDQDSASRLGIARFLKKPVDARMLLETARDLLEPR